MDTLPAVCLTDKVMKSWRNIYHVYSLEALSHLFKVSEHLLHINMKHLYKVIHNNKIYFSLKCDSDVQLLEQV